MNRLNLFFDIDKRNIIVFLSFFLSIFFYFFKVGNIDAAGFIMLFLWASLLLLRLEYLLYVVILFVQFSAFNVRIIRGFSLSELMVILFIIKFFINKYALINIKKDIKLLHPFIVLLIVFVLSYIFRPIKPWNNVISPGILNVYKFRGITYILYYLFYLFFFYAVWLYIRKKGYIFFKKYLYFFIFSNLIIVLLPFFLFLLTFFSGVKDFYIFLLRIKIITNRAFLSRFSGFALEPQYISNIIIILLSFFLLKNYFKVNKKKIEFIYIAVLFLALFFTYSTGGYVVFLSFILVFAIFLLLNNKKFAVKFIIGFILFVMLVYIVLPCSSFRRLDMAFTSKLTLFFNGESERGMSIINTKNIITKHPILGVGIGNTPYFITYVFDHSAQNPVPVGKTVSIYQTLWGIYFQILAETGVVGLASFLFILGFIFFKLLKLKIISNENKFFRIFFICNLITVIAVQWGEAPRFMYMPHSWILLAFMFIFIYFNEKTVREKDE